MRYAKIDKCEICNGLNVGVTLFVQGCSRHCYNCFNPETWDFNGGKEWTEEIKEKFMKLIDKPYIKRVTILGGEPLDKHNIEGVYLLLKEIKDKYPDKKIWLYTGSTVKNITPKKLKSLTDCGLVETTHDYKDIINLCDVIVDGEYVDSLRDITLPFRGSSNQRLIDVKKTADAGEIVLYELPH